MSVIWKKKIPALALASLVSGQAIAGFQLLDEGTRPKPSSPVQMVTQADENARLLAELERLSAELAQVKSDLESARTDATQSRQALLAANAKLDLIQSRIEKIVVPFAFGATTFTPRADIAEKLVTFAKLAETVTIRGYTDSVGPPAANQHVALQRATAAKQYLINQGVEEVKISISAHAGEYAASNTTRAGRLANRRVEIDFLR